jgi:uncharacterized membrane protein YdcZ (DUF606 family)
MQKAEKILLDTCGASIRRYVWVGGHPGALFAFTKTLGFSSMTVVIMYNVNDALWFSFYV